MMKKFLAAILLASALVSCGDKGGENGSGQFKLIATSTDGHSFAQDDCVGVYFDTNFGKKFTLSEGAGSSSATFTGALEATGSKTASLYAIYPFVSMAVNPAKIAVSLEGQSYSGSESDVKKYLVGKLAAPFDPSLGKAEISLSPITASFSCKVKNSTGKSISISHLDVSSTGSPFALKGSLNIRSVGFPITSEDKLASVGVDVGGAVASLAGGSSVVIPISVFPTSVQSKKLSLAVTFTCDGKSYLGSQSLDLESENINSGDNISLEIDLSPMLVKEFTDYKIVYPASASSEMKANVTELQEAIRAITGMSLEMLSDATAATSSEILVGATNRSESSSLKPQKGWGIKVVGEKLVIKGSSDDFLVSALYAFEKDILKNPAYAGEGVFNLTPEIDLSGTYDDELSIRNMLDENIDFNLTLKEFKMNLTGTSAAYVSQGCCSDGSHVFQVFKKADDSQVLIYKYSFPDMTKVGELDLPMQTEKKLCHVNDLAYQPSTDYIWVSGWATNDTANKVVYRVKASDLSFVDMVSLNHSPTALAHNPATNRFLSRSGTKVYSSDQNFKSTKTVNTAYDKFGYTNQGSLSDEGYVYFTVSPAAGCTDPTVNQLLVFDWNGKQLLKIALPTTMESESGFHIGSRYFLSFYHSAKCNIYELIPHTRYTYNYAGGDRPVK